MIPSFDFNPKTYCEQLELKLTRVKALFNNFTLPQIDVIESPREHFRMRAEFRLWHEKNATESNDSRCYFAMFDGNKRTPIEIPSFPIASKPIAELMPKLLKALNSNNLLAQKCFQIEFLSTTTDELLVTLIYHKPLNNDWQHEAELLAKSLDIKIIGRSKKQRIVLDNDYVTERLTIHEKEYRWRQTENSFTQPNAIVNQYMISWICDYLLSKQKQLSTSSLLEMYCGNGNFTIPMSQFFSKVLATEISKTGIANANFNAQLNDIKNIHCVRLSGEETTEALDGVREFRRLAEIDLDDYQFSTVFVDPPRAGLDDKTLDFIKRFENILYISCNPETLSKNLRQLSQTHEIEHFAVFDQFAYTPHLECGTILTRKSQ